MRQSDLKRVTELLRQHDRLMEALAAGNRLTLAVVDDSGYVVLALPTSATEHVEAETRRIRKALRGLGVVMDHEGA